MLCQGSVTLAAMLGSSTCTHMHILCVLVCEMLAGLPHDLEQSSSTGPCYIRVVGE